MGVSKFTTIWSILIGLALCITAQAQDCECVTAGSSQVTEHNCPNIDPTVTQVWTVCGSLQPELVAYGDCALDYPCLPVLGQPSVTSTGSSCRWYIEHKNRIATAQLVCRDGNGMSDLTVYCELCNSEECEECDTVGDSPILITPQGNRARLTDVTGGVFFDLDSNGVVERTAWTVAQGSDSFLALDRNGNTRIDNGAELFGNHTPQPASTKPNGFLALAVYDEPSAGGNADGWIDQRDAIFQELVLWNDWNHDGVSQPGELTPVRESNIRAFDLRYRESRRTDRYGNSFRYISTVMLHRPDRDASRTFAVDVFFAH